MISRFEKVILIILAGLGAGYLGFGLLLLLSVPGDYNFHNNKYDWLLAFLEVLIIFSFFLSYELVIIKDLVRERRKAWLLFFLVIMGSVLFHYVYFQIFGPIY